jgi:carboxylesterase type B
MKLLLSAFVFFASIPFSFSQGTLTASLDYGTFAGAYSSTYNISYWQKIPFAAPPTGQNRFRAPQPPTRITNGTYNSTQTYPYCPQRTGPANGTEDCLYLGLWGRPWTKGQPLRPVVVNFYGGAFIEGGSSFSLPPAAYTTLNVSQENDIILVAPNYRVNAFGFLPGKEIAEGPWSDLNPGLLDQQAALMWTHKYIDQFGGDPGNVTIWGQSAGAGSVVAQVIANNGNTQPKLFTKALASSPFWPKTYVYDAPQAQWIYDTLANLTNCMGPRSLQCLKGVDTDVIREAAIYIDGSHTYNLSSYTWAPVIDGKFITQPLSQAIVKGQVNTDLGWGMYNLHEGENFIPPGLQNSSNTGSPPYNSSLASFENWLHGYLPFMSEQNLQKVRELYPIDGTAEELVYNTTYVRAGLIYRDTVLACPAFWMARAAHERAYVGEYTASPAKHGSDTEWVRTPYISSSHPPFLVLPRSDNTDSRSGTPSPPSRKAIL